MKALVVIPAYNEEEAILSTVRSVEGAGYDYVVVNDGSTDGTLAVCKANGLNVLDLSQNLGIGGAVQTGHKYALAMGYDADVQFDGDGQHNVEYIAGLLEELENGADLAIGSRFLEPTDGFQSTVARRIGIRWLSWLIKLVTGKRISDPTSGLRASGPRALALFARDYPIDYPEPESIVTALSRGLTVREVPAVMNERATGSSSIKALSAVYYMAKVSLAILVVGLLQRKK